MTGRSAAVTGDGGLPESGTDETRGVSSGCRWGRLCSVAECTPDMIPDGESGDVNRGRRQDVGSGGASRSTGRACVPVFSSEADSEDAGGFPDFPVT